MAGRAQPIKDRIAVDGRFVKQEKEYKNSYNLYLKVGDSIMLFKTVVILDETEINMLKKKGNNMHVVYQEYFNPVKKTKERIVRSLIPDYGR